MKKNIIKLSLLATVVLTSSVYAGNIITDADQGIVTANKQFGYGGWNLDNVDVKIVQLSDHHHNIGTFNEADGTYSTMGVGYSFESDIYGVAGVMGRLHGKDWPVGEPSGVKIINGDTNVHNGKPENCIMTTSYLASGYLNSPAPVPNTCSGPHKSHKRFKIDMMRTTYIGDNAYGSPIEMVFNLQSGDSSTKRYQIFQKINNYTEKRLNGFKIEVLDANKVPNPALTLSIGIGEYVDPSLPIGPGESVGPDSRTDIWDIEDLANMSHGLWGPIDDHFYEPGFFDDKRVYYPVSLSVDNTVLSYVGNMQGGNYQEIFGNWLPSKWHPMGISFDHDGNPATDPHLVAFWGDPLHTGVNGWHKGFMDDWASPTEEEIAVWTAGAPYAIGGIEDSVNLGLNYIVNVGDNVAIGTTFTLRITPHFAPAAEQNTPSYVNDAPLPNHPGSERDDPNEGSGGGCTYNPVNKKFDMMFLFIFALGLLYPIRRKFVK
jgi:hypothetical protein